MNSLSIGVIRKSNSLWSGGTIQFTSAVSMVYLFSKHMEAIPMKSCDLAELSASEMQKIGNIRFWNFFKFCTIMMT